MATTRAFQALGAIVHVTGTRSAPDDYSDPLDGLHYHRVDLSIADSRPLLVNMVGPVDVVVDNAGTDRADEYTLLGFEAIIDLNLNAVMDLLIRYHDSLATAGGAIINVGSLASFIALRESLAFHWSKPSRSANSMASFFSESCNYRNIF